ncbi:PF13827 domain protein [Neisseria sicca VK64]|uniref:PF13827 domain protein n=1 Tax=Neisseria sicca VK64 TaxID=1095748 RepID=I2NFZ6_NEISI|nr:PF13827 domain protein [Neisseria sicca VK64]
MNPDTGYVSGVLNQDSLSKAKETALAECRKRDSQGSCKIVSWVRNGCIAGAEGKAINPPGHWRSFYMGTEKGLAEAVALAKCKADSSLSNCRIILPEGCSLP